MDTTLWGIRTPAIPSAAAGRRRHRPVADGRPALGACRVSEIHPEEPAEDPFGAHPATDQEEDRVSARADKYGVWRCQIISMGKTDW